jgi:Carboxypeptidase regulatory-like domain
VNTISSRRRQGRHALTSHGNVAARASYRGVDGFITMQVEAGGLRRYYRAVSGFVTDSQDGTKIAGVTVRILDGPNANRSTTTGTDGAYQLYDLELGTFTIQFSNSGYVTLNTPFTLTGDKFNDASVKLVRF